MEEKGATKSGRADLDCVGAGNGVSAPASQFAAPAGLSMDARIRIGFTTFFNLQLNGNLTGNSCDSNGAPRRYQVILRYYTGSDRTTKNT